MGWLACLEDESALWGTSISIMCPCYKAKVNVGSLNPCKKVNNGPRSFLQTFNLTLRAHDVNNSHWSHTKSVA